MIRYLKKPLQPGQLGSSQAGVSLISAMIALAFVMIIVVIAAGSLQQSALFRRIVAAGEAYRDVEQAFQQGISTRLWQQINAPANGICSGGSLSLTESFGASGMAMALASATAPFPTGVPPATAAAVNRCNNAAVRTPWSQRDFYFCLNFTGVRQTAAANTTLSGASAAFAEVQAYLFDAATGAMLNCAAYRQRLADKDQDTVTLEVHYSLYWYTAGPLFKQRNGAFYARSP